MKKTKILSFILAVLLFAMCFASFISAIDARLTNTIQTITGFDITEGGLALVSVNYLGREELLTSATITITIKKRFMLLFWNEVTTHTITSTEAIYDETFEYQLEDTGTYKCNVEYVITGSTGATDTIPFEDTATY